MAAEKGHAECVKLLIEVCDVRANGSEALRAASIHQNKQCVDLLLPLSDGQAALNFLQAKYPTSPDRWRYLEEQLCKQQRDILSAAVGAHETPTISRKL